MALRIIEIIALETSRAGLEEIIEKHPTLDQWSRQLADGRRQLYVLLETKATEALLDDLETYHANEPGFRLLLQQVEATIPAVEVKKETPVDKLDADVSDKKVNDRISRHELYNNIAGGAKASSYFYLNIVIATVVAAIGLVRADTAIIIAAMVIAPLLGPNMALALATTLGDKELARNALWTNGKGLAVTVAASLVLSLVLLFIGEPVVNSTAIMSRTEVGIVDVLLALAAGAAGALAYTHNVAGNLVGVMVAVALLPPVLCTVLLATHGEFALAGRAFILFVTNVAGANLAAVSAFLLSGIRPRTWWEADRASRAARRAITAWAFVLALLLSILFFFSGE
ncbi:MAG: putative hydrophobic protein (TIGR00341 family) [Planctomycetota bacterium]|jgi:uncharacterized hydrophobic protein (TIGR00341 family)